MGFKVVFHLYAKPIASLGRRNFYRVVPVFFQALVGLFWLKVGFFLPAFGTAIWLMATLVFALYNWERLTRGDRRVYIPLVVIVAAISLSGITADRWTDKLSPLLMGGSLLEAFRALLVQSFTENLTAAGGTDLLLQELGGLFAGTFKVCLPLYAGVFLAAILLNFSQTGVTIASEKFNLDLNKIIAYAISGLFAAFTSLIVIARIGQSQPAMGVSYPLETIAAAVIGGVALSGGKGTIPGVFFGVILLGLIRNSLNILRVPSFYQYVMLGSVIIIAVTVSNLGFTRRAGNPS